MQAIRIPPFRNGDHILLFPEDGPAKQPASMHQDLDGDTPYEVKSISLGITNTREMDDEARWLIHLKNGRSVRFAEVERRATDEEVRHRRRLTLAGPRPYGRGRKPQQGSTYSSPPQRTLCPRCKAGNRPSPGPCQAVVRYGHAGEPDLKCEGLPHNQKEASP